MKVKKTKKEDKKNKEDKDSNILIVGTAGGAALGAVIFGGYGLILGAMLGFVISMKVYEGEEK